MKFDLKKISLKEINLDDDYFRLSDHRFDRKELLDSLDRHGVLFPPAVVPNETSFRILTGFRRISGAKEIGLEKIPVYILNNDIRVEEAFSFSIEENKTTRTLNLFEKATALWRMEESGLSEDKIINTFMPLMGLQSSPRIKEDVSALLNLPENLVDFILFKNLAPKNFRHLKGISPPSLGFFENFVRTLLPSASDFIEVTKGLSDLSRKHDQEVKELARSLGIEAALALKEGKKERLEKIKKLIAAQKFPTLTKINQNLEKKVKNLESPPSLKISWDQTLERSEVAIELDIREEKEFDRCLETLKSPKFKKTLKEILKNL